MDSKEFNAMKAKALEQLKDGTPLLGKDGAFAPLLKEFLESALDGEMEAHLSEEERNQGNKRNGKGRKTVRTGSGSIEIETPQDRLSTFEPKIIAKRETILSDNLAPQIIGMYGRGMSLRDISSQIQEMYDYQISANALSEIIDRINPQVEAWQNRTLEEVYPIVWLDAMHYKVRVDGRVESRAVYNVLGVNCKGYKELIGVYISESEGAKFWLQVLTDLQNRGVKDILIACTDNLKGFVEAISSVYPKAEHQLCIIHQIRNSVKFVSYKYRKEFMKDLKPIYRAPNLKVAEQALNEFENKWGEKYPVVIDSWRRNWTELTTFFQYNEHIRKLIYTTNAVEGFHRQVRKVTKSKGAFPTDMALLRLIYLSVDHISKKWTRPLNNWGETIQQLCILYGDRVKME